MSALGKILAFIVAGLIFAFLGHMVVVLPFAPLYEGEGPAWVIWAFLLAAAVISYMAPTPGKAWRRLLISSAVLALLLPISILLLSIAGVNDAALSAENSGAATAGAMIGGGMVTAFTGFVGFFLGAVFLIIGLLVGRDRPANPV